MSYILLVRFNAGVRNADRRWCLSVEFSIRLSMRSAASCRFYYEKSFTSIVTYEIVTAV